MYKNKIKLSIILVAIYFILEINKSDKHNYYECVKFNVVITTVMYKNKMKLLTILVVTYLFWKSIKAINIIIIIV